MASVLKIMIFAALVSQMTICATPVDLIDVSHEISTTGYVRNFREQFKVLMTSQFTSSGQFALQTNIWRMVFSHPVSNSTTNYAAQIRNLSEVVLYLLSFDACLRDAECWNALSYHLGVMSPIQANGEDVNCRAAYERDQVMEFVNRPRKRFSGSQGRMGPNMKAWNERWIRRKMWNVQIDRYRRELLPLLRKGIRSYMDGMNAADRSTFQSDFCAKARLSREESCCLFGDKTESCQMSGNSN